MFVAPSVKKRYNRPMKLKIGFWRITWRYLVVYFIIAAIAFGSCFGLFFSINDAGEIAAKEFGVSQIIFILIFAGLFIVTYLLSLFGFYYIVEDKCFIVKRLGKEIAYDYSNIQFIDIAESKRKKQVIFYTKVAHMRYMLGDKEGILLETLIKKCPDIMTLEQFRRTHPEERY